MVKKVLISVITPSYNSARYLEEAIQSVMIQEYPNFEHIIIDGGSSDSTINIFKKYPHLIWISEPDNGQSDAMNKGIKMATGEVIVVLNADDFFEPGAFFTAIKYLDKTRDVWFVAGECNVRDVKGNMLPGYSNPRVTFFEMLQWWRYLAPQNPVSYFYYKEVHDRVGLFDVDNHYNMDYDFLFRVALEYKILKIPEILGNYRYIEGTKTFESGRTDHSFIQLKKLDKYWKYLNTKERIQIKFSFLIYYKLAKTRYCFRISRILGKIYDKLFSVKP